MVQSLLIFDDQRARLLKTDDCVCLKGATIALD